MFQFRGELKPITRINAFIPTHVFQHLWTVSRHDIHESFSTVIPRLDNFNTRSKYWTLAENLVFN